MLFHSLTLRLSDRCQKSIIIPVIIVLIPLLQAGNLFLIPEKEIKIFLSDLFQTLAALIAFLAAYSAAAAAKQKDDTTYRGWIILATAAFSFLLGMISFMFAEVVFKEPPYPGFPDVFFIAFYPFIMAGLFSIPLARLRKGDLFNLILDISSLLIAVGMIIWNFSLYYVISNLMENPSTGLKISFVYNILDSTLLFFMFFILLRRMAHGVNFGPILVFIIGCFCLISADLAQAYISASTDFTSGSPADMGWVLFSTFASFAGIYQIRIFSGKKIFKQETISRIPRSIINLTVAYIWLFLIIFLLIWSVIYPIHIDRQMQVIGTTGVILLVLIRQYRALLRNEHLTMELNKAMEKLRESNREIENTLSKLKSTQNQLLVSEKEAMMGLLSAGIAHELNTPLAAILSSIGSMKTMIPQFFPHLHTLHKSFSEQEMICFNNFMTQLIVNAQKNTISICRETDKHSYNSIKNICENDFDYISRFLCDNGVNSVPDNFIPLVSKKNRLDIIKYMQLVIDINKTISVSENAAQKAAHIVNALHTYTDSVKIEKVKPVNLTDSIDSALQELQNSIGSNILIKRNYYGTYYVSGDRERITLIWKHIINNALQALNGNGEVTINVNSDGNVTKVSIANNGPEIPEHIRSKIYDPFFTTNEPGHGAGLGLSIAKSVVEFSGGNISFETGKDGTVFHVNLKNIPA